MSAGGSAEASGSGRERSRSILLVRLLDEIYEAGSEGLSLEIDEAMLREALAITSRRDLEEVLPRGFGLHPTPQAFRDFESRLRQTVRLQVASQGKPAKGEVAAQVLKHYLDAVCSLLINGVHEMRAGWPPRGTTGPGARGRADHGQLSRSPADDNKPQRATLCQPAITLLRLSGRVRREPDGLFQGQAAQPRAHGIEGPGSGLDDRARGGSALGVPPRWAVRPGLLTAFWRTAFRYPSETDLAPRAANLDRSDGRLVAALVSTPI